MHAWKSKSKYVHFNPIFMGWTLKEGAVICDFYTKSLLHVVYVVWWMEMGQQDLCNKAQSWGARWASFRKSSSVGTWGIDIASRIWGPLRDYPLTQFLQTASPPWDDHNPTVHCYCTMRKECVQHLTSMHTIRLDYMRGTCVISQQVN